MQTTPGSFLLILLKTVRKITLITLFVVMSGPGAAIVTADDATGSNGANPVDSNVAAPENLLSPLAVTVQKPRWEFGLAGAALQVPAYPSSSIDNRRNFFLPWFVYRSDKVRLQGGALKLVAVENSRVTVDVSLGGSLNADSASTPLRAGMPDLDFLFEIGPKVDLRLWDTRFAGKKDAAIGTRFEKRGTLIWSTALRAAVSTDFRSVNSRGYVLGSVLRYRREGLFGTPTTASISIGPIWATEKLQDFFYEVNPAFEVPGREAFDASAGYLGTNLFVGVGHKFSDKISAFVGVNTAIHSGARNVDSPLFEDETTTGVVFGLSWAIKQSRERVSIVEE